MKGNMAFILKIIAIAATFAVMAIDSQIKAQTLFGEHKEGTLCRDGEKIIFSCDTRKKKKIAVCAKPHNGSSFEDLRYRYGTPTALDISFPNKPTPTSTYVSGNILSASETAYLGYLHLRNKGFTYSVFMESISPQYVQSTNNSGATEISAQGSNTGGVVVEKEGHVLTKIMCEINKPILFAPMIDPVFFGPTVPLDHHGLISFPNYRHPGINGDFGVSNDTEN